MRFSFAEPEGLTLARPVPHPWAAGRQVGTVGSPVALPAGTEFDPVRGCYEDLVEANARLQRVVDSEAPEALVGPAVALSGAWGNQQQLIQYVGGGLIYREDGSLFAQRGCWRDGLSVEETKVRAPRALWGLAATNQGWSEAREAAQRRSRADYHILGRAARAAQPGVVFARAAERGETEPLTSLFSRLFAGLPT